MIKKTLLTLAALLCMCTAAQAQQMISCTKLSADYDQPDSDPSDYGMILLSKTQDLVVSVPNDACEIDYHCVTQRSDGYYEYLVRIRPTEKMSGAKEQRFLISNRGSIYSASLLLDLKRPDVNYAYRVDNVEVPIYSQSISPESKLVLDDKLAAMTFKMVGHDINVEFSPELQATKNVKKDTRANTTTLTLTIPLATIKEKRQQLATLDSQVRTLSAQLRANDNATEDDYLKLDELTAQLKSAGEDFQKLTTVYVWVEGSNRLPVSAADLQPRGVQAYGILIAESKTGAQCKDFVVNAGNSFKTRHYREAKALLTNALNSEDCDEDLKPTIRKQIAECDTCIQWDGMYKAAMKKLIELKKGTGQITQAEEANYYIAILTWLEKLNEVNPSEYYQNGIGKFRDAISSMPLQLRFGVNRWDMGDAGVLGGVEIYAYYGTEELPDIDQMSNKKFGNLRVKNLDKYVLLGTTDAAGQCTVELDRQNLPALVFLRYANDDERAPVVYLPINNLLAKATGSYMMKQFRTRMYVTKK